MKREKLEEYLDTKVKITLFDGKTITGTLKKSGTEEFHEDLNLYLPQNYYFLTNIIDCYRHNSCLFRCSHVKSIVRI